MLKELIIIFIFNYMGIVLSAVLKFPIPGTILGMFLFFLSLMFKIIKVEQVENAANFLIANLMVLLIVPSVGVLESYHLVKNDAIKIVVLILITTFVTMGITGKIVQVMIELMNKKEKNNERNNY